MPELNAELKYGKSMDIENVNLKLKGPTIFTWGR